MLFLNSADPDISSNTPSPTNLAQPSASRSDNIKCTVCNEDIVPQSGSQTDGCCFVSLSLDGVVDDIFYNHHKCLPLNPVETCREFHDVSSCLFLNILRKLTIGCS